MTHKMEGQPPKQEVSWDMYINGSLGSFNDILYIVKLDATLHDASQVMES